MDPVLRKKRIFKILTIQCIFIAAASVIYIASYSYKYFSNKNMNNNIASLYENIISESSSTNGDISSQDTQNSNNIPQSAFLNTQEYSIRDLLDFAEAEGRKRFSGLLAINEDFLGMLIIDGLDLRLPYVQYKDNSKYLNTNFEGDNSNYGTVFLSCYNDRFLLDKNNVFFGHHMNSGDMFTPIIKYQEIAAVEKAPIITLDSLTGKTTWLIFAAYTCEPDYGYIKTKLNNQEFSFLLDEINSRSLFHTNVDVYEDDQILTLSTCAYDFQDARFAVHARKLRPGEEIPEITAVKNPNPKPYNVPMQKDLSELAAKNTAVMRHPNSLKTYYYQMGEGGIEWYVGNTSQIQGAYSCYAAELDSESVMSAIYFYNQTILAIDRFNGNPGISLLTSGTPSGVFTPVSDSPITPKGVDARYPLLAQNGNELWLLYTLSGERDEIYRARIKANGSFNKPELILTAPKNSSIRAAGMVWSEGRTLFIWHEKSSKQLFAKLLDEEMPEGEIDEKTAALFGEPKPLSYSGAADRITIYGVLTDGKMRMMSEKNGLLVPSTFDVSQILPPKPVEKIEEEDETVNENDENEAGNENEIAENENNNENEIVESENNNENEIVERENSNENEIVENQNSNENEVENIENDNIDNNENTEVSDTTINDESSNEENKIDNTENNDDGSLSTEDNQNNAPITESNGSIEPKIQNIVNNITEAINNAAGDFATQQIETNQQTIEDIGDNIP